MAFGSPPGNYRRERPAGVSGLRRVRVPTSSTATGRALVSAQRLYPPRNRQCRPGPHRQPRKPHATDGFVSGGQVHRALTSSFATAVQLAIPAPQLAGIDHSLGVLDLIDDPSERRGISKDHAFHGAVVAFYHCDQFRLGDDSHRSWNRLLEPLSGLAEGYDVVSPDRIQQADVRQGRPADIGRRYHGYIVVVARDPIPVSRQALGVAVPAVYAVQDQ